MKIHPSRFTLKNGKTLVGRRGMSMGSSVTIRTETGDVEVEKSDIVSEEKP